MLAFFVGMLTGAVVFVVLLARLSFVRCLNGIAEFCDSSACKQEDHRAHRALHVAAQICRAVATNQCGVLELVYVRALERSKLLSPEELASKLSAGAPPP